MTEAAKTSAQEWRAHWPLVMAATFGLSFGAMPTVTLGLFMQPLNAEFGWTASQVALGMTIFALITTPLTPFAGALVDRYGARAVGLPSLGLTGLMFAAFALMGGPLWQWFAVWVLYSLASLGIRTPVWNSAVSANFLAGRGFAIAVVLSGMAVTQMLAPTIAHWLTENYGWRVAYAGLGLGWGGMGFILVLFFFHDARSAKGRARAATAESEAPRQLPGGLTLRAALRDRRILRIATAMLLQALIGGAIGVHLVPLLGTMGISRGEAAALAGALGIGSFCGKLISGWMVDQFKFAFLPFLAFSLPGLGYALLLALGQGSLAMSAIAILLVGLGGGATLQITIYLTSRYGGVAHFGKIFGIISSLMGLAGGLGPLFGAVIFDATGNYSALLLFAIPVALIAALSISGLGPYPHFPPVKPPDRDNVGSAPAPA